MEIWLHPGKVKKIYEDLEEVYSFLCRRKQELEEVNARIWLYIDIEGMQTGKKMLKDIIVRMEKNIRYLDQLLRALEKMLQKYQNNEEKLAEKIDETERIIQRWENVTYNDLSNIKSLLKDMLS